MTAVECILDYQLLSVIRAHSAADALWVSETLIASGLKLIEIPFTVPDAASVIRQIWAQLPDENPDRITVGAGTILTVQDAERAVAAGAEFLVSPVFSAEVLRYAQSVQIPYIPGCLTPTEIYNAHVAGCPMVKIYPISQIGGAAYLKQIRTVMPTVKILVSGGVTLENLTQLLLTGAGAAGIGQDFFANRLVENRDAQSIMLQAREYLYRLKELDLNASA